MYQLSQQELWEKIRNFQLDDLASAFPFSKKLAQENNWTRSFANRAIEEYKKFIFLCCISPTGASPSQIVDEVWHLHLTYTDNYWNQFCKNTLAKEIHHHPSKGGQSEKEKHVNWYQHTLTLYEQQFKTSAPADIWPPDNLAANDITDAIYEPDLFKRIIIIFILAVLLLIMSVNFFHTKGINFLVYYLLLCTAGLITLYITQWHKENRLKAIIENNLPKKFTPYQMARFLYGNHRCYQTALVDLLRKGIIKTYGNDYKITQQPIHDKEGEDNPLLQPLLQNFAADDFFTYREGLALIDKSVILQTDIERLHRLSLKVDYQKLIIPGIILLIGFARFLQGMANEKPVGFLVLEIGIFGVAALAILQSHSYTKLVRLQVANYWEQYNCEGHSSNVINNFTILGTPAIAGFAEYPILKNVFHSFTSPQKNFTGGGDSGSACSSGGCGSSCGGGCGSGCGGCSSS